MRGKTKVPYDTFLGALTIKFLKASDFPRDEGKVFPTKDRELRRQVAEVVTMQKLPRFSLHGCRRYFIVNLKLAGVNSDLVEYMAAHRLQGVRSSYFLPPPVQLAKTYVEFEKYITPEA